MAVTNEESNNLQGLKGFVIIIYNVKLKEHTYLHSYDEELRDGDLFAGITVSRHVFDTFEEANEALCWLNFTKAFDLKGFKSFVVSAEHAEQVDDLLKNDFWR